MGIFEGKVISRVKAVASDLAFAALLASLRDAPTGAGGVGLLHIRAILRIWGTDVLGTLLYCKLFLRFIRLYPKVT